ncbi:hypothetical protein IKQ21_05940, partial [bacterium]|nr:hypothetical protein [bacterium]
FIDKQGYLVSFLIQDGLGMTAPRIGTGLFRDREETGKLNFKEATEVMLREVLSGPYMMAVAPAMVLITGLFCKSMRTNTKLIKLVGDNFKAMIKEQGFDKAIQKDPAKFKEKFYRYSVEKFYRDTVPNDKNYTKAVDDILNEFKGITSSSMKTRGVAVEKITEIVNQGIAQNSNEFDKIGRLSINLDGKVNTFKVKDAIYAIRDFGIDAIERNNETASIDEGAIENIKNNLAARRLFFNIANIVATLVGLSIIPKIYARGKVAPGAERLLKAQETQQKPQTTKEENKKEIGFKGKGINSDGILAKLGKFLIKTVPDWMKQEFEYDGINFTKSLMASLALFGLLLPRGKKAYDRALVDENGKKDLSELNEILLRDTISSLGVVYTVPILTKCFVKACESNTGFVLTNRASKDKSWYKKFLDVINPYSNLRVFSSGELQALYNNIDNKAKMINLCEYITIKEGDLSKILSKSENSKLVFNKHALNIESLQNMSLKEKNETITNFFKKMDETKANELIKKIMQDAGKVEKSSITRLARGLYSVPGAITTVIISPVILGCLVPMLTYSNTRKAHAKMTGQIKSQEVA